MDLTALGFWEAGTLNGWVTVAIALGSFVLYILAYHTYGRWLAKKVFKIDPSAKVPAIELRDDVDFVPSKKVVVFGHHFTSIAGTGPIVGPAIAIIWGWLPALIWVLAGSIFMGAVHDFGALIVSMRNKGQSIGEVCAKLINPRVRTLFSLIIFFALLIVIAIFGLVIAVVFMKWPESVIPVWLEIPIALILGYAVYKRGANVWVAGVIAVVVMYATVVLGAFVPMSLGAGGGAITLGPEAWGLSLPLNPIVIWTIILLVYVFFASSMPVQKLLQPRDYINAYQLFIAMALLIIGVLVSRPTIVAPAVNTADIGAPGGMWPLLFVTIACGAISGFHSLVASGTSPKQLANENGAKIVGYGSMLTEGMLAVLVIIAVAAGIGLGATADGQTLTGTAAWTHHYASWGGGKGLPDKLAPFIDGGANMMAGFGIPLAVGLTIMGVFVASFAGTTLDTATRLQRYIVAEFAANLKIKWLTKPKAAAAFAVITAGALALQNGGKGGLLLWPLFGTINQLLAGLALLTVTIYLAKRGSHWLVTFIPMVFMLVMTGWALTDVILSFAKEGPYYLMAIGILIFALEVWMVVESVIVFVGALRGKQEAARDTGAAAPPAAE